MFERFHEIQEARADGDEAGFTLIELLIVIVVLGVLAAVVIFGLSGITGQSAQAACNADAKTVEIAVEAYHAQQGTWPPAGTDGTTTQLTKVFGVAPNTYRYLRTFPSNHNHYDISVAANGIVQVTPNNGQGTAVALAVTPGPYDYDGTTALNGAGPPPTSANPCSYVQ